MDTLLILFLHPGPGGGFHGGPGHFPGFFWLIPLVIFIVARRSRREAHPTPAPPAAPHDDRRVWPDLDPAPESPTTVPPPVAQEATDESPRPEGPIEYL